MAAYEKGAWVNQKLCPHCGLICVFVMGFKRMGEHMLHVCRPCGAVYLDGKVIETLTDKEVSHAT